jgi:hypothetical protein
MRALDRADLEVLNLLHLVATINVAALFTGTGGKNEGDGQKKNNFSVHHVVPYEGCVAQE